MRRAIIASLVFALGWIAQVAPVYAKEGGEWEVTPESKLALERGLEWLKNNQGEKHNWNAKQLGLVSLGMLAFLSDGHMPGRGKYGKTVKSTLDYVLSKQRGSGLFNVSDAQKDNYNHGLTTLVLGQVYGMTNDKRVGKALDRALRLIANTQCGDGGWGYNAVKKPKGNDLSLAVMQAKAIRSAMDSGIKISPEVRDQAISFVRKHYRGSGSGRSEASQRGHGGQFVYAVTGNGSGHASVAMAAAGVVCLQELGEYDDWRIPKNMEVINAAVARLPEPKRVRGDARMRAVLGGGVPFDPYTLYYVSQAVYQAGGDSWRKSYPKLRDGVVAGQILQQGSVSQHGMWQSNRWIKGADGTLFGTAVACFVLAIPNRYLPILQEGKIKELEHTK